MTFAVAPGADAMAAAGAAANAASHTSWRERLKEAAYNAPSGTRIKYEFMELSREIPLRTAPFDFPGVDNSYVQQNGIGSRRYPMRCFFHGRDHDRIATAFEAALCERGIGKLEHPMYGTFDVVPFGDISRRNDLVREANQSVIEVTFWTTVRNVYPSTVADPQSEILAAIAGFDVELAQQFNAGTDLKSATKKANAISTMRKFLKEVSAKLQKAADSVASVRRQFADMQAEVNFGLDVLVGQPILLAQRVSNLIKAPARAFSALSDRLDAYDQLALSIISSVAAAPGETLSSGVALATRRSKIINDVQISNLFAANAVAGSVVAAVAPPVDDQGLPLLGPQAKFQTKPQALEAAAAIHAQFEQFFGWQDSAFEDLEAIPDLQTGQLDTGETIQALRSTVALTLGHLVNISFTLVPERSIVLTEPTTILNLAAMLYRRTDDATLNFLISTNHFTGSEILEVGRFRKVVYYPDAA